MRLRRTCEMLMLFVAGFAAFGSEPVVTSDASPLVTVTTAAAAAEAPAEEQQVDSVDALIGDTDAPQMPIAQPLPRPLVIPPDDELSPEPPSCTPRRRAELRRGFVRMLAELARAVAH